jgi:predicted enzyme related to lactoylglutathione lyase
MIQTVMFSARQTLCNTAQQRLTSGLRTFPVHERSRVMSNCIVWVDIPVTNLDRAIAFYSAVIGTTVSKAGGPGFAFGLLPHASGDVGGCLYTPDDGNAPSLVGPLIYINAEGRLVEAVEAAAANGGQVLQPIHQIGPHGSRAIVLDTEGNRIALHTPPSA